MGQDSHKSLEQFIEALSAMIRARYPLLYLNTFEETRSLEVLSNLTKSRKGVLYVWSRTDGVVCGDSEVFDARDPLSVLKWYGEQKGRSILVLKDYHPYLKDPGVVRKLRDLGHSLKRAQKNVILLSPVLQIPPELNKEMAVMEVPLPNRDEIGRLVQKAAGVLKSEGSDASRSVPVEELTDAASGLTYDEIENVLAKSIVSLGRLDTKLVRDEKRQIVKKSGLLEFVETGGDLPEVGGLHQLRHWLKLRRKGLSAEARSLRLPVPKGILLVGIPGCGKSLTAMTVGREWQLPLIRLDMGKVFSGLVGSSEGNIRNAVATCEAVSPCVLWIDEIEKGLSGTQSSGSSDGGTTSRVFGTLLTWMQEKKSAVFVVATANDIASLPPEFLRKGRFDEIFFVDLPSSEERREIFNIHLNRFGWEVQSLELDSLVELTDGFSGSEIEQVLVEARYLAFGQDETFEQAHIEKSAGETVPLSKTMADRIEQLRSWASHRARPASQVKSRAQEDGFELRTQTMELNSKEGRAC